MLFKDRKRDILTVPNLLSLFRLLLIPVYVKLYLNAGEPGQYYTAGTILALSCLTDALDGFIARRWNQISMLGKILDPLADKLTQFAVVACLCIRYTVLRSVMTLLVIKEMVQTAVGCIFLRKGKILSGALICGKICTSVLFISLTALVLFPGVSHRTVNFIAIMDILFLFAAFFGYLFAYLDSSRLQDLE